ncbi:hypothetical protein D7D52_07725 [Nocardia yunnanensis]|uniref:Uncharacterized protein n=1 Tax=Nocardia yunnanensis TaxID=2382165 RepID=A0A386Z972_9NOCA|nr:hypothetical protein [Nocardia yunnanensis]AYF73767.1 hypothetical protein D7D52_07725 [Nocardia yunnanensis]
MAALVRMGEPMRALDFTVRIPLAGERIRALALVVPVMAEQAGPASARAALAEMTGLLGQIPRADLRDRATATLVGVALAIGDARAAVELARGAEPDMRARLLVRVADARARDCAEMPSAEQVAARREIGRLLAEAWNHGPWYSGLDVVARFDPRLLGEIADAAIRLESHGVRGAEQP